MTAAGGLALAFAAGGVAHAVPSYGFAELHFQDFTLSGINLATSTNVVQAIDGANYPNATAVPAGSQSVFGNVTTGVDISQVTAGPGAFPGENTFTQALLPASALSPSGTRSDGNISGALAGGATSDLVAEGKLSVPNSSAGSNSGSNTSVHVTFSVASGGTTVDLTFSASAMGNVAVGSTGDNAGIVTTAQFRIHDDSTNSYVSISDLLNGAPNSDNVRPDALNLSSSTLDPSAPILINNPLTAYHYRATLGPGTYTLSLLDSTQVTLSTGAAVPEPASMAIIGTGMLGLGLLRLRRKKG
jgi:hypothetical protein